MNEQTDKFKYQVQALKAEFQHKIKNLLKEYHAEHGYAVGTKIRITYDSGPEFMLGEIADWRGQLNATTGYPFLMYKVVNTTDNRFPPTMTFHHQRVFMLSGYLNIAVARNTAFMLFGAKPRNT